MRRSFAIIGLVIVAAAFIIPAGSLDAAEFPSVGDIFNRENINFPDIDVFGQVQDLLTNPSNFESVLSLSGFVGFLGDTFGTASQGDTSSIAAVAMLVCILIVILCLVSAFLGRRKGNRHRAEKKDDAEA